MTSNCLKCGMPRSPNSNACLFCNAPLKSTAQTASSTSRPFQASAASYRPIGPKEAFISWLLEVTLMIFTLGIGGLIWSFVLALSGQTPASRIRDDVYVSVRTGRQASAWKLLLRQVMLFLSLAYILSGLVIGFGVLLDIGGYWIATRVIPGILIAIMVMDVVMIFTPFRRRLIDWALGIRFVDGAGHSYKSYQPGTRGF